MKHTVDTKYNASSEQSSASTRSTDVSLFFGSYHSESSESQATSASTSLAQSVEVEVGFRATLVTIDRGGWFQPQFFKQSAGFHCIDKNITWSKWPSSMKTFQDLMDNEDKSVFDELNRGLIPAFPTGFIVCKVCLQDSIPRCATLRYVSLGHHDPNSDARYGYRSCRC